MYFFPKIRIAYSNVAYAANYWSLIVAVVVLGNVCDQ